MSCFATVVRCKPITGWIFAWSYSTMLHMHLSIERRPTPLITDSRCVVGRPPVSGSSSVSQQQCSRVHAHEARRRYDRHIGSNLHLREGISCSIVLLDSLIVSTGTLILLIADVGGISRLVPKAYRKVAIKVRPIHSHSRVE